MSDFLIIYSSTDGHTKTICEQMINLLDDRSSVKLVSLDEATKFNLIEFNKIIIGASIRYGKHSKELYNFIKLNKKILEEKKSIFFSVNVVARKPEKNSPDTNPYVIKFLAKINWKPKNIEVFAGRIDYPKYKFIDKYAIKFIMWVTKGPTDTSQSYEFTDWNRVEAFAENLNL